MNYTHPKVKHSIYAMRFSLSFCLIYPISVKVTLSYVEKNFYKKILHMLPHEFTNLKGWLANKVYVFSIRDLERPFNFKSSSKL